MHTVGTKVFLELCHVLEQELVNSTVAMCLAQGFHLEAYLTQPGKVAATATSTVRIAQPCVLIKFVLTIYIHVL